MDVGKIKISCLILLLGILLAIFQSCKLKDRRNEVSITINLDDVDLNGYVYVKELNVRSFKVLDSVKVKAKGRFSFRIKQDSAGFLLLGNADNNFLTLQTEPGEKIEITLKSQLFQSDYLVSGSPGSSLLKVFFDQNKNSKSKVDSLGRIFNNSRESSDFTKIRARLDSSYNTISSEVKKSATSIILKNLSSLASVYILNQSFGPALIFSEKDDFELFRLTDSAVFLRYPTNKHSIDHHQRVHEIIQRQAAEKESAERLASGQTAPEIKLKDINGIEHSLRSEKEKVTVLYFWQSMCGKCRRDHPALRNFYSANKNLGVNLWVISLDDNSEMTQAAVKLDKIDGLVFNIIGGINAPLAKDYNITQDLPVYYIIGRDGTIVSRESSIDKVNEIVKMILPKNIMKLQI